MPEENKPLPPSVPKSDGEKPVVWTPEDASRFLTSAIHEAQRPLSDALKNRPITSKAFSIVIAIMVFAAMAIALLLSSQLEKTEQRAEAANRAKDELMSEKAHLQARSTTLEERLTSADDQITTLRGNGEELQRTRGDLARFRRQNELLRNQISGLEMEKVALARQLEAVKAMAIDEGMHDEAAGTDPFEGKGEEVTPEIDDADAPAETAPRGLLDTLPGESAVEQPLPAITTSSGGSETIAEPVGELQPTTVQQPRPQEDAVAPEPEEAQPEKRISEVADPVIVSQEPEWAVDAESESESAEPEPEESAELSAEDQVIEEILSIGETDAEDSMEEELIVDDGDAIEAHQEDSVQENDAVVAPDAEGEEPADDETKPQLEYITIDEIETVVENEV